MNTKYTTDGCVFQAYQKIIREAEGLEIQAQKIEIIHSGMLQLCTTHSGIACLNGLKRTINLLLSGNLNQSLDDMIKWFLKIYEHRCLMIKSIQYVIDRWDIESEQALECLKIYSQCCETTEKWKNMMIKCKVNNNCNLLKRIALERFLKVG